MLYQGGQLQHNDETPEVARMMRSPAEFVRLRRRLLTVVFFQPFQLFADLDVAVPGILVQTVTFTREDQERVRDAQGLKGAFHSFAFQISKTNNNTTKNKKKKKKNQNKTQQKKKRGAEFWTTSGL